MVDGVTLKINNPKFCESLNRNPNIILANTSGNNTGELTRQAGEYKGLSILFYPNGSVLIKGSIHKYFNAGHHNYNDFSLGNFKDALIQLSDELEFDVTQMNLHGFEYGLNLKLPFEVSNIIDNTIFFKHEQFKPYQSSHKQIKGKECEITNQTFKIYSKKIQHKLNDQVIRIENKANRMRYFANKDFKKISFNTVTDLMKSDTFEILGNDLIRNFNDVIIFEKNLNQNNFSTDSQRKLYDKADNPNYWRSLHKVSRFRKLKEYNSMVDNYCSHSIKKEVLNLMSMKITDLL